MNNATIYILLLLLLLLLLHKMKYDSYLFEQKTFTIKN